MIKKPDCGFTLKDLYEWKLDDVRFSTEKDASFNKKKRSIDVYGESRELILVIENKVNAKENYNDSEHGQTWDYYEYVEAHKAPGQRALYFFITADQRQYADSEMYVQISYQEMYDNILQKCIEHPQIPEESRYLLEQYAVNLQQPLRNSNTPMALVHIEQCKALYEDYRAVLDEIYHVVETADDPDSSRDSACAVYTHYQKVFDEIYASSDEYAEAPKSRLKRQNVDFMELYKKGVIRDGMRLRMNYGGEAYHARIALSNDRKKCFLQLLDENGNPIKSGDKIVGIYAYPSRAGVEAINYRRMQRGLPWIKALQGTTYWVTEDGLSIKDLIDGKTKGESES